MWSATLIREARLRAGLTQQELADRTGRKRSVIARWERGEIAPSLETFLEILAACGFELPLEPVPRNDSMFEHLRETARLTPERRVQRLLKALPREGRLFDPHAILAALESHGTAYVVVGAFGRVVQGADEITDGLDITPSLRGDNLRRLELALDDLGAARADARTVALDEGEIREPPPAEFRSAKGTLKIVAEPAGTRDGFNDLRRAASREPIGKGVRIPVASTADLARMLAALGRESDISKLVALRRLQGLELRSRPPVRP